MSGIPGNRPGGGAGMFDWGTQYNFSQPRGSGIRTIARHFGRTLRAPVRGVKYAARALSKIPGTLRREIMSDLAADMQQDAVSAQLKAQAAAAKAARAADLAAWRAQSSAYAASPVFAAGAGYRRKKAPARRKKAPARRRGGAALPPRLP